MFRLESILGSLAIAMVAGSCDSKGSLPTIESVTPTVMDTSLATEVTVRGSGFLMGYQSNVDTKEIRVDDNFAIELIAADGTVVILPDARRVDDSTLMPPSTSQLQEVASWSRSLSPPMPRARRVSMAWC